MTTLNLSLQAWNTATFTETLKQEICSLDEKSLPLQQGLRYSSIANAESLSVTILDVTADDNDIKVKVGLFYTGIIAGCNCADDPSPADEITEYCVAEFSINRTTAQTVIKLIE
jgi:hypothetical protein